MEGESEGETKTERESEGETKTEGESEAEGTEEIELHVFIAASLNRVMEEIIMLDIIPGTEQMTTLVWEIFMHHTLPERPRREFCSLP